MPLLNVRELRSWHKIRHPVFSPQGATLLAVGTPLTKSLAERLKQLKMEWVHVCDREVPDAHLRPVLANEVRNRILREVLGSLRALCKAFQINTRELQRDGVHSTSTAYVRERFLRRERRREAGQEQALSPRLADLAGDVAEAVMAADPAQVMPIGSNRTPETLLAAHGLDVAIVSGMLAREFGYERDELSRIILGALLHDAGYAVFPEFWFTGDAPPEDEEPPSDALLRRAERLHPVLGYIMLKDQASIDLLVAHVAYQHHERQDGSGFPRGLKGPNRVLSLNEALKAPPGAMHRYANIVAVANVLDRLTCAPPFGEGLPADGALGRLRDLAGTYLNRQIVERLTSVIPPHPVGSDVWVADGEYAGFRGVVTQVRHRRLDRPVVRLVFNREGKRLRPVEIDTASATMALSPDPPSRQRGPAGDEGQLEEE